MGGTLEIKKEQIRYHVFNIRTNIAVLHKMWESYVDAMEAVVAGPFGEDAEKNIELISKASNQTCDLLNTIDEFRDNLDKA